MSVTGDEDAQLLKIAEVCDLLRIGITRVYELIAMGVLPSVKIGALRRIPRKAVVDLAREGLKSPEPSSRTVGGRS